MLSGSKTFSSISPNIFLGNMYVIKEKIVQFKVSKMIKLLMAKGSIRSRTWTIIPDPDPT
jgi:hypothetical protein